MIFCKIMLATHSGIFTLWWEKRELRAPRQYSVECHRSAHKGNTLKLYQTCTEEWMILLVNIKQL